MKTVSRIIIRHVTLMEILIAMVLTSFVLMTLTFFYQEVVLIGVDLDNSRNEEFYMRYIEKRLMDTVSKSIVKNKDKANDFVFFSTSDDGITKPGSQSLVFMYDNGFTLDKAFSNHVLGRLYLDDKGNLTLAYWPSPKRWELSEAPLPMKKEILFQGVDQLSFEFFIAPAKSMPSNEPTPESTQEGKNGSQKNDAKKDSKDPPKEDSEEQSPEPKGDWTQQLWLKDYDQLPVLVKVVLTMSKEVPKSQNMEKLVFVIPLINTDAHILYD